MLLYIYILLVSHWYNFIKKFHYWLISLKNFLPQCLNYRYRDSMSEARVISFHKYICDEKVIDQFLCSLDDEWKRIAEKSIINIKTIAYNNFIPYQSLYDDRLVADQKKFATYVLSNHGKYFKNFDYLYLTNDYYLSTLDSVFTDLWWKAILDCWAFIGDTAIPFANKYINSTIHAFEPENSNYQKLIENIEYNHLQTQILPVKLWVGDQNITTTISDGWAGAKIGEWDQTIEITTIDSYAEKQNLNVWMIKRDIEWFEYESILGAQKTIQKDRPVLIISLYHRGKDFFEIIEMLKSWGLWYKFTVRKWNCFHPFADTVLIAY